MKRKDLLLILSMIIISIGIFLPAIKIANENISFLKENGSLMVVLVLIMFILYRLNKKEIMILPSTVSIFVIIRFILNNRNRLHQINDLYNCYADFRYGLFVMIIGNLLIILTILITLINYKQVLVFIKNKLVMIKEFILTIKNKSVSIVKSKTHRKKNLKTKKELNKDILMQEKTDDGIIKYNKIVVKLNNNDKKNKSSISIKEKLKTIVLSLKVKRKFNKKLSVTKFSNEYKETLLSHNLNHKKLITYQVPIIDIRKWTRDDVCCINCGATISSNSEYCFLCDCKVKLSDKQEKLS